MCLTPKLSALQAPSASARRGKGTSVVLGGAGREGEMVTIQWMPNPIFRYRLELV